MKQLAAAVAMALSQPVAGTVLHDSGRVTGIDDLAWRGALYDVRLSNEPFNTLAPPFPAGWGSSNFATIRDLGEAIATELNEAKEDLWVDWWIIGLPVGWEFADQRSILGVMLWAPGVFPRHSDWRMSGPFHDVQPHLPPIWTWAIVRPVPEPKTLALLALAFLGFGLARIKT